MTERQFADFEAKLIESRIALDRRLDAIRSDRRHTEEPLDPDFAEQAVQRENDETLDGLDAQGQRELEAIEAALARIQNGTYGECLKCGESIPEARLYAYPTAAQCITCASTQPRTTQ